MILTLGIILGLCAGGIRSAIARRPVKAPELTALWLLFLAFILQALILSFSWSRQVFQNQVASLILIGSMGILLVFCWLNRTNRAIWVLALGVFLNLLVICLNGGWMPISPETIQRRSPQLPAGSWTIGERLGSGKDIVLTEAETRLPWLSDRFVTPAAFPLHVAFSLGDVLISIGMFLLLWSIGDP